MKYFDPFMVVRVLDRGQKSKLLSHQNRENSDISKGKIIPQFLSFDGPCNPLLLFWISELCPLEWWFLKIWLMIGSINWGGVVNLWRAPLLSRTPLLWTCGVIQIVRSPLFKWTLKYYFTVCEVSTILRVEGKVMHGSGSASWGVELFLFHCLST